MKNPLKGSSFIKLNNKTNTLIRALVMALKRHYDTDSLREQIVNTGHPVAIGIFTAWEHTKKDMKNDKYTSLLDPIISYVVWKALNDTAFRGPFIRFLRHLCYYVSPAEIAKYDKDADQWKMNVQQRWKNKRGEN